MTRLLLGTAWALVVYLLTDYRLGHWEWWVLIVPVVFLIVWATDK